MVFLLCLRLTILPVMLVKMMYLATSVSVFYTTHRIFDQGNFALYGYDILMSIPEVSRFILRNIQNYSIELEISDEITFRGTRFLLLIFVRKQAIK